MNVRFNVLLIAFRHLNVAELSENKTHRLFFSTHHFEAEHVAHKLDKLERRAVHAQVGAGKPVRKRKRRFRNCKRTSVSLPVSFALSETHEMKNNL